MTATTVPVPASNPEHRSPSSPVIKFLIGLVASICAVLFPRLLAALTIQDSGDITFVTGRFLTLALIFSVLVGLVVMILEWRLPRAPGDTFMTTLGLPAILAGALTANQNTLTMKEGVQREDKLAVELGDLNGIAIESGQPSGAKGQPGKQGSLIDLFVTPVYAQAQTAAHVQQSKPGLGIVIDQPRYFIVFDRARTQQEAEKKATQWRERLKAPQPARLEVQQRGNEYLVVIAGGPRIKSEAVLEAVRLKSAYQIAPTLVEASSK